MEPIVQALGFDYVDTEYVKQGKDWVLTVFIDKPGGVNLEDCEAASRKIELVLDEKDLIADKYCLCVSSPGLDRPLKSERDFKRCMGKMIDIKLYKPFLDRKAFTGKLSGYGKDSFTIEDGENEITFLLNETAKISLHVEF